MEDIDYKISDKCRKNFHNHLVDDFCYNITLEIYYSIWVPIGNNITNRINNQIYINIFNSTYGKCKYK